MSYYRLCIVICGKLMFCTVIVYNTVKLQCFGSIEILIIAFVSVIILNDVYHDTASLVLLLLLLLLAYYHQLYFQFFVSQIFSGLFLKSSFRLVWVPNREPFRIAADIIRCPSCHLITSVKKN